MKTVLNVDSLKIPFTYQLVSKQVDIPCDGILGTDSLEDAEGQISYASLNLTLGAGSSKISKTVSPVNAESQTKGIRSWVLCSRTVLMVGCL